ncbi:hypothetical protein SAMN05444392_11825 [Seinonella peptonophila]|uniref:Uncharacterized protein n=1 Tax=Seinonella peptonophila TaxID=112248 RepID=A0A1M5B4S8_9BACL|nr:hypothetical protein SAMN05444392_11825 [Seinonella peptonophila]
MLPSELETLNSKIRALEVNIETLKARVNTGTATDKDRKRLKYLETRLDGMIKLRNRIS